VKKIMSATIVMLGLSGPVRVEDCYTITSKNLYAKASEGFTRAGVRKAISAGLAVVMLIIFGFSPLTSYGQSNYVTEQERRESKENEKLRACESLVGKTFTANPPTANNKYAKDIYSAPNIHANSFTVRNPEEFVILKLVPGSNCSLENFKEDPYYKGFYKIQFQSGKQGFVPVMSLHWIVTDMWGNVSREIDAWGKLAFCGD